MLLPSARKRLIVGFAFIICVVIAAALKFGSVTEANTGAPILVPAITATKVDTIFTDVDGDGRADPGDTILYTVTINNTDTTALNMVFSDTIDVNTTLVGGSVNTSPIAFDDPGYTAAGNVRITIASGSGVLVNDIDPDTGSNTGLTASAGVTSAQGGNVAMSANGGFSYNPAPGFTGTDTFTYTVTDAGGATGTGTVTFNVSGMIWFVNAAAGGGGDGRLTNPFNCLVGAGCFDTVAADDPGDNIFLYTGAYTGGLTLLANQRLIGAGATASLSTITGITPPAGSDALPATGGANPTVTTVLPATNGVNLGSGNTVRGFTIGNITGTKIVGSSFGGLTISNMTLNGSGADLNLNSGTVNGTIDSLSSTSSTTAVTLVNIAGTFDMTTGAISGASGDDWVMSGSVNGSISYGGTITNSTAHSINISGKNAGTITFSGLITDTAGSTGILLNANTGATINFTGGLSLTTTTNAAFTATGGGTVNATQNNTSIVNTLTTTTGTALNVANTTIGASGLTFRSISANGAANGIVLNTTGTSGSLVVTGNAGSCTSAATCTGGAIQATTGDAISLNSTQNPSFTSLFVGNTGAQGFNATNLTSGLTLTSSQINDTGNAINENAMRLFDVSGTVSIQGTNFNNTAQAFLDINSTDGGGNLSQMILNIGTTAATTFTQPNTLAAIRAAGAFAGNGILIAQRLSKNYTINISNTTFTDIKLFGIQFGSSGPGSSASTANNCNVNLNNNQFQVTITNALGNTNNRANTINIQGQNTIDIDASITNNTLNKGGGGGIQLGADTSSNISANITGNTVTNQFADGILMATDENASLTVLIDSNTITNTSSDGMEIANAISPGGVSTLNATITNNTVTTHNTNVGGNSFFGGICVFASPDAADTTFVNITGNNVSGNPNPGAFFDYVIDTFGDVTTVQGAGVAQVFEADFLAAPPPQNISGSPAGGRTFLNNAFYSNGVTVPLPVLTAFASLADEGSVNRANGFENNLSLLNPAYELPLESLELRVESGEFEASTDSAATADHLAATADRLAATADHSAASVNDSLAPISDSVTSLNDSGTSVNGSFAAVRGFANALGEMISPTVYSQERKTPAKAGTPKDGTPNAPMSGETITVNGGSPAGFTLPGAKSITITYRATINTPPPFFTQVSNQGSVSGSNFGVVLTDDPSVGGAADPTVTPIDHTTVAVASDANPSVFGQNVTFTATMTGVPSRVSDPPGTVQFKADGNNIGAAVAVVAGAVNDNVSTAQVSASNLSVATHVITAEYSGGGAGATGYNANIGTLAGGQVVNKANTTTTITNAVALGTSTNTGQSYPVTWSVTVNSPGSGTPTGDVTVSDGTDTCIAAVATGTCNLTSTTVGTKTITAAYPGDGNFNLHTSAGVPHTVLTPTAANTSVSGRVLNRDGRGVAYARVALADENSNVVYAITNPFGFYRFTNVASGQNYVVSVTDKRYRFQTRLVTVNDELTDLDFVAQ